MHIPTLFAIELPFFFRLIVFRLIFIENLDPFLDLLLVEIFAAGF